MIKNKFIFLLLILIFSTFFKVAFSADSCKYKAEIDKCNSINESKWSVRSIKEFICIEWDKQTVTFQVVLDKLFTKQDEKIEEFLYNLEESKNYFFWPDKKETYIDWVDYIEKNLWTLGYFEWEYKKLCDYKIVDESLACLWEDPKKASADINYLNNYFWNWLCSNLYTTKLSIYKKVAYEILKENKKKIDKDLHKEFTQKQRKKYDELLDSLMVNLAYLERIWKGWTSKTKIAY